MYTSGFENDLNNYSFKPPEHWVGRHHRLSTMEIITIIISLIGIIVVLILLCRCCRRSKQGQIISPPPPAPPGSLNTAPYPQQQFVAAYPAIYGPVSNWNSGAQVSAPYPTYPAAAVPMPMPAVGSPAPVAMPVPTAYPHPVPHGAAAHAPTAPDLTAIYGPVPNWNSGAQATLPPSYEQATGVNMKQSPYNPGYPHS